MMAELAKAINEAKADNPQIEQQIFRPTTRRPTPARIPANPISPKREKSPSTSSSYSKASTKRLSDSRESSPEVVASGTAEIVPSTQPPESPAPKRQNISFYRFWGGAIPKPHWTRLAPARAPLPHQDLDQILFTSLASLQTRCPSRSTFLSHIQKLERCISS